MKPSEENPNQTPSDEDVSTKDASIKDGGERPTNVRWLIFTLACGASWFLYLHRYTWNVIRPLLEKEYGFSNTELEGVFTIFNLSYALGQIPSGIVCDFFGAHLFLAIIIIAWSVTVPCLGLTGNITALSGIRLMFGAAQAGGYPSLGRVTRVWFPKSTRTIVQGWVASFFGRSGGALSPIIMATFLMGMCGLSWRIALIIMSSAGVLFGIAFLIFFRESPDVDPRVNDAERELIQEGEAAAEPGKILPFGRVLRNRAMMIMLFQQVNNAGADIVYTYILGSYFLSKGVDFATMGFLASLPMFGGAVGGVAGGYCNDWLIRVVGRRWGRSIVGFAGKVLAAGALFYAIQQNSPLAIAIGLFIVKFFTDMTQPTVWGTCTDLGGKYSATVFSINNTAGNVGAMVMPMAFGVMLDFYSHLEMIDGVQQRVTNYDPMFMVIGVMYLISACCWLAIDCTQSLDEDDDQPEPAKLDEKDFDENQSGDKEI